ncbi:MAG: NosD domain-containing protein, partial [Candidatus Heimdallarchaeaceae archaeon]
MHRKGLTSILVILAVLICSSNNLINNELMSIQQKDLNKENINTRSPFLTLTAHEPIEIASDGDFDIFPGAGTPDDPYIIEGFTITTTSYYGIYIHDTTKYFIVRNCFVDAANTGIYINNTTDGTATIVNNTCSNNWYGISLWYSDSATLTNNTCSNNGYSGISLWYSDSATLTNNTCSNNNNYGIYLWYSYNATLVDNTFLNDGLHILGGLDTFLSYSISNNYVNGKLLGYFININDIIIDDPIYGQLFIINGTNVTIKNQVLTNTSIGITVMYSQAINITNNTCINNNWYDIWLYSSDSATLTDNTCSNNNYCGIWLYSSDSATLTDNTCSNNNYYGIWLYSSDSATLTNNTCSNNSYGISLCYSNSPTLFDNIFLNDGLYISGNLDTFLSCTISNNYVNGKLLGYFTNINDIVIDDSIYGQLFIINGTNVTIENQVLTNTSIGITVMYSQTTTLTNNTCSNNQYSLYLWYSDSATLTNNTYSNNNYGIYLFYSDSATLINNTCMNNNQYGIYLYSSSNTTLINNTCSNN